MEFFFRPEGYRFAETKSLIHWESVDMQNMLRRLFNEQPQEELYRVIVSRHGLSAYFRKRDGEEPAA